MESIHSARRSFVMLCGSILGLVLIPRDLRGDAAGAEADETAAALQNLIACSANGVDSTHAFQRLIDLCASTGETVQVPDGLYLIDADIGIHARNLSNLQLGTGTRLRALPSRAGSYSIVRIYGVRGVKLAGGSVEGERHRHLGKGGEWGFGVDVRGSSGVSISNVAISNCWGDGLYIGSYRGAECNDVTLNGVVSTDNRRQGLSITVCNGVLIENSTFASTSGTPPAAGIDIEPNLHERVSNVTIKDCTIYNNAGSGIQSLNAVSGVVVTGCNIYGNGVYGIYVKESSVGVVIKDNHISVNKHGAIHVDSGVHDVRTIDNVYPVTERG